MSEKRKSWLPAGGSNLFQEIKRRTAEAEAAGKKVWKLTIGQPAGPALGTARKYAAEMILRDDECVHEYQDNGSPGILGFAEQFVRLHQKADLPQGLSYLPVPGTKPMLGLIPMACGLIGDLVETLKVGTMTDPGYPTPAVWCGYLGADRYSLPINDDNGFLFSVEDIANYTDLLMLNYPHNPTGQVADKDWWRKICEYCSENEIRLFNDSAYSILSYNDGSCNLAEVAHEFPELSWCEAYSASKVIGNGTGWRVGAMVGASDFIGDIATIKGNTDSGFVAPMAYGVLKCMQEDMSSILASKDVYRTRINILTNILEANGMRLAVTPSAGFFTLWLAPKEAFGQSIKDAEEFNYLMIERTGVAGVHFGRYIRYAVTSPVNKVEWISAIDKAFQEADVKY